MSGGSGGSDPNEQALRAAASVLGGQLANTLGGVADTVTYDSTTGLSAGWALSTDLFLSFAVNPMAYAEADADENKTSLKLSWFIGNHTQADFATGDAGDNSSWLYWTTRF
jgi:hypothetical protein